MDVQLDPVQECEKELCAILNKYGCTLVFEQVYQNGEQVGFSIKAVKQPEPKGKSE